MTELLPGSGFASQPENQAPEGGGEFSRRKSMEPMKYGPHPKTPPNESFWTQSFVIPEDFPTGTLDFTVTATDKEGRIGTFAPIHYAPSALLQVLDKVRPVVPQ